MIRRQVRLLVGWSAALALLLGRSAGAAAEAPQISTTPGLFPAFSATVSDYVVRCQPSNQVQVSVTAPAGVGVSVDNGSPQSGSFTQPVALSAGQNFTIAITDSGQTASYFIRCLPSDFPAFTATRSGQTQAEWYVMTPNLYWPPAGVSPSYVAFFDDNGVPVWWMRSPSNTVPIDAKLLANGDVAWLHSFPSSPGMEEHRLDGSLVRALKSVGTATDQHDVQLLSNGNYLLGRLFPRNGVDMSACGGSTSRTLVDFELQEITPGGALVWAWRASDHIPFSEVPAKWRSYCSSTGDIYHWNAVAPDGSGYVLSFRQLDAVYHIERATGAIDWKLGGVRRPESLTVIGDPLSAVSTFGGQHDVSVLGDGSVTVFDDGSGYNRRPRAVRYSIDATARTATLLESVTNPNVSYSSCCGSARKLPGGDWVISWGSNRPVTEQSATGAPLLRLAWSQPLFSYRANPVLPGRVSAAALRAGMDAQFQRLP
jgi:Arylsulfotransferase (ASST)